MFQTKVQIPGSKFLVPMASFYTTQVPRYLDSQVVHRTQKIPRYYGTLLTLTTWISVPSLVCLYKMRGSEVATAAAIFIAIATSNSTLLLCATRSIRPGTCGAVSQ